MSGVHGVAAGVHSIQYTAGLETVSPLDGAHSLRGDDRYHVVLEYPSPRTVLAFENGQSEGESWVMVRSPNARTGVLRPFEGRI